MSTPVSTEEVLPVGEQERQGEEDHHYETATKANIAVALVALQLSPIDVAKACRAFNWSKSVAEFVQELTVGGYEAAIATLISAACFPVPSQHSLHKRKTISCRFFLNGMCRHSDEECNFLHAVSSDSSSSSSSPSSYSSLSPTSASSSMQQGSSMLNVRQQGGHMTYPASQQNHSTALAMQHHPYAHQMPAMGMSHPHPHPHQMAMGMVSMQPPIVVDLGLPRQGGGVYAQMSNSHNRGHGGYVGGHGPIYLDANGNPLS